jgi:iron complex transport system ATP-binding protein
MLLLRRLSVNTNKTFILSTHELDLALQIADKIWLFTENHLEFGIPEDLMLSERFQKAFGSDKFKFDEEDGHYKVNQIMGPLSVSVVGEHKPTIWLTKALTRCGIRINETSETVITAFSDNTFSLNEIKTSSIEETINILLNINFNNSKL